VLGYEQTIEALADPTRRRMVEQLSRGPSTVGELAGALPVSRPAVSQHLRVLLEAGLVSYRSQGTRNVYRLEPAGFDTLRIWLDRFWRDVLDAFESHADEQSMEREEDK
jgi:DNA-binding transcriptional ArsR family regulator